jgi:hypothetical protein
VQVGAALLERRVQQLEQPGADDGAVAPDAGDLVQVELELGLPHHLEALRVRLHQPVLDPVVDHLHEVPGARPAHVRVAVRRRERRQCRLERPHRLLLAAGHQAVADLEPPDAAGDADVDEVDPALGGGGEAPLRVAEVGVAAVDDRVAGSGELEQLAEGRLRDLAGRHHRPEDARRVELVAQLGERPRRRLHDRVVRLHLDPVLLEALRHVAAHAAEADHPELHRYRSSMVTRATRRPRSRRDSKSPAAWARISRANPNGLPGIFSSSP